MLHLHRSNRLECLADALAEFVRVPCGGVFQPELIVVQSLGMRRWLSLELAHRLGVTMNCAFPFPAAFAHRVFRAALGDVLHDEVFHRELLPWRIFTLLPSLLTRPAFADLLHYAGDDSPELKRFQLALKIGGLFDRYLAYRPELSFAWQAGSDADDWQAQLWRSLLAGRRDDHPPALLRRLCEHIDRGGNSLPGLPPRIAFFGISSLAPLYLDVVAQAARCLELHLFLLEPTPHFWGDIRSRREQSAIRRKAGPKSGDLHLTEGNRLLASLGKVARDFVALLAGIEPVENEREAFEPPASTTLLGHLQAGIYNVSAEGEAPAVDGTIQIHCCHSPMREVEVLHDQLLELFRTHPELTPKDVLVGMPDVSSYAPFIEAVFGAPEKREHEIPFSIADRATRSENSVADTFLRILDLRGSRFGVARVLAILDSPFVQRRFTLGDADLETIRGWVDRTCIRWGIDGAHRQSLGIPASEQNTWSAGLRRLALGYALPGDGRRLFAEILPFAEIEGSFAETCGRFLDFTEVLFASIPALDAPRTLPQWEHDLLALAGRFFDREDAAAAPEFHTLALALAQLSQIARRADLHDAIGLDVVRAHLAGVLGETDATGGFLTGGVTFCALKPMRSIPFKVVGLLGMNDTAFPRHDTELAFDRMAGPHRKPGDRSARDDDRQLFLEAIFSARDVLYISYTGLSQHDDGEAPPSVVVSELIDALAPHTANELVTKHRMQPFSRVYFEGTDPRRFSFSAENRGASSIAASARTEPPAFIGGPLAAPGEEWNEVRLDQLAEFFCNPAQFFIEQRLGLRLPDDEVTAADCEPMALSALEETVLRGQFTNCVLERLGAADTLTLARAGGTIPHGTPGAAAHAELHRVAEEFARKLAPALGAKLPPLPVDLEFPGMRVRGTIDGLYEAGAVRWRAAKSKPKDLLRAWIRHLALNATATGALPRTTRLFATDRDVTFRTEINAHDRLASLLDLYRRGLREPLRFFPASSLAFAAAVREPQRSERAMDDALRDFNGSYNSYAERNDQFIAFCYRGVVDPLAGDFASIATMVFEPLLSAMEEVS